MTTDIRNVVVLGAGTMGSQIAAVSALAGYETSLVDVAQNQLDGAKTQLEARLTRDIEKGRRPQEDVDAAWARLSLTTDRDAVASQADLVIEAAVEDLTIKREIFAELDAVCPDHTLLVVVGHEVLATRRRLR